MGKKCIPGLFCIENMTLFMLFVIFVLIIYLYYTHVVKIAKPSTMNNENPNIIIVNNPPPPPHRLTTLATRFDPFNDPYAPPLKSDGVYYPRDLGDMRGIPVNIESRGLPTSYQQIGILTRVNGNSDMILPLMGRQSMVGRDKWQYYTISNSGNLNTKLPVSLNGKSCTSEYGCNSINNGDNVYVEGYNDSFRATIYESNSLQYLPYL
jgi:hypothetical protein